MHSPVNGKHFMTPVASDKFLIVGSKRPGQRDPVDLHLSTPERLMESFRKLSEGTPATQSISSVNSSDAESDGSLTSRRRVQNVASPPFRSESTTTNQLSKGAGHEIGVTAEALSDGLGTVALQDPARSTPAVHSHIPVGRPESSTSADYPLEDGSSGTDEYAWEEDPDERNKLLAQLASVASHLVRKLSRFTPADNKESWRQGIKSLKDATVAMSAVKSAVNRLLSENEVVMEDLVQSKIELAQTREEIVIMRRQLVREERELNCVQAELERHTTATLVASGRERVPTSTNAQFKSFSEPA